MWSGFKEGKGNANRMKRKGDESEAYRERNLDLACRRRGLEESKKEPKNPNL